MKVVALAVAIVLVPAGATAERGKASWYGDAHHGKLMANGCPFDQQRATVAHRTLPLGSRVRVTSRVGAVEVDVAASDDLMPGVVSLPHGYGHAREGVLMARSREVPGVSVNDLTDPELLDVSGNAALNGVPVAVTAAG